MTSRSAGRRRALRAAALVVGSVLLVTGAPGAAGAAGAGGTAQELGSAREQAERLRAELDDLRTRSAEAAAALETTEYELGTAVARANRLGHELDAARSTAGGTDRQLQRRVAALYRSGGSLGVYASLLRAESPADLAARMANVDKVVASDARLRDRAAVGAGQVAELEEQARSATAERVRLAAAAQERAAQLASLLEQQRFAIGRADARVTGLVAQLRREEQARRLAELRAQLQAQAAAKARAAAAVTSRAPASSGGLRLRPGVGSDPGASADAYVGPAGACPVGPVHSFTDTWHAPRSGGRKHQGTDVFAPYGSPAYAVVDGVVDQWSNGRLGGIALWLRGDNGDRYYYAHNVANVAKVGQRVEAGQLVAYVGTTGNAATTPPHIHFQAHPGGGPARNPYPWLRALCG